MGESRQCTKCDKKHKAKGLCKKHYDEVRHKKDYKLNKKHLNECSSNHYQKNRDRYRENLLKRKYNITLEEYNQMVIKQSNKCAICNKNETAIDRYTHKIKILSVDHDHRTNKVRGLLCNNCNHGIGNFCDNVNILEKAIIYLT